MVTEPRSAGSRPDASLTSVVFPEAEVPTMETNSPASTLRFTRSSTHRAPKVLAASFSSISAMRPCLDGPKSRLREAHQAVEREAHHADGENAEKNVRVDQAVVLLPQEAADAG